MPPDISSADLIPDSADLMVLETPLLRVSRPVAACQRCRAAKVKCDGKLPACTACEKSNKAAECSSTNDQFARGKERSYVATLEGRVERLERKLLEAQARRKSSVNMLEFDSMNATPRRLSVDMSAQKKQPAKTSSRKEEASRIDDLVADFGLLAVNATARDFYGFTSAMTYARLILSACSKEPMPTGMTKALPPRYAATPLIQHYFNNIFVLLPVFEEASFYGSVDAVYNSDRTASAFDHWTVRMVLALSCISCSDQRGDTHYLDAVGHVNAALEYADEVLHPGFITNIQALLLLVEYSTMDPQHFHSWHLIGAASRAMIDLGIHQEPSKSAGTSRSKLELRRRVYWCVYALDRVTSLVHSQAFSFSDDSAHVLFPFQSSVSAAKGPPPKTHLWLQSFDSATSLFKLRQMQSQWYTDLFQTGREPWTDPYPYIWRTYNAMTEWYNGISSSTLPSTKSRFELELLYSYVYILSPSSRCPRISTYARRLIFEHCIAYSTNMLAILNDASSPTTKTPMTFYDAMRTYMTGRQLLDVLNRNLDALLDPVPPTPPTVVSPGYNKQPSSSHDDSNVDPFASALPEVSPPPFPAPVIPPPNPSADPNAPPAATDPTSRAITALNDFTSILSRFGGRFGHINWRDRFQNEAAPLLNQLYNRASISPTHSPDATYPSHQQYPGFGLSQSVPPPPIAAGARAYEWGNGSAPAPQYGYNMSPPQSATGNGWNGQPQMGYERE